MDWAEKITLEIILPHVECEIETEETCKRLSAALRKAKADGLREAADMVWSSHTEWELRVRALAVEKGE